MSNFRRHEYEARNGLTVGAMTGTTAVEIVASPASGFVRVVKKLRFHQRDTVSATIHTSIFDGTSTYFEIDVATKAAGETHRLLIDAEVIHITEGYSLTALLGGAVTTNEPTFAASWVDVPLPV